MLGVVSRVLALAVGAVALTSCLQPPSRALPTAPAPAATAIPVAPPTSTALAPTAATALLCAEAWRQRVRRPERFTEVASCVTFEGVVRAVKREPDGDMHVQVLVDPSAQQYINARNTAAQHGALVLEIEPWEHGAHTRAADPTHVDQHTPAPYCPAFCSPVAGDRLRVTSAITTDNEKDHGWNEAHSPTDIQIIGHGPPPHGDVPADPTDEQGSN